MGFFLYTLILEAFMKLKGNDAVKVMIVLFWMLLALFSTEPSTPPPLPVLYDCSNWNKLL